MLCYVTPKEHLGLPDTGREGGALLLHVQADVLLDEDLVQGSRGSANWSILQSRPGRDGCILPRGRRTSLLLRAPTLRGSFGSGQLKVSQPVFASMLNVSRGTVRAWEQGAREPEGPTRRLLELAEKHPEVIAGGLEVRAGTRPRAVTEGPRKQTRK